MYKSSHLEEILFKKPLSRRKFMKLLFSGFATAMVGSYFSRRVFGKSTGFNGRTKRNKKGNYDLVLAQGEDPYRMTAQAIEAMGGMGQFVKRGDTVVIKPNMSWDRAPEYAANTNPLVVAALVELCFQAGARRVNVFDRTCNAEQRCYQNSGVKDAALSKGARVYFVDTWNFVEARFKYTSSMEGWPIFRDAIKCDTFINVPVLKHHSLTNLTLSMKNLMGVCCGDRAFIHDDIGRKLVDLTDFISPDLTVIDAYRVLTEGGPSGGGLQHVVAMKQLLVATDPTLADTYACHAAGVNPQSVPYLAEALKRGFGNADIEQATIFKLHVS
jgi:uncharacterized protein (DUF362 family)